MVASSRNFYKGSHSIQKSADSTDKHSAAQSPRRGSGAEGGLGATGFVTLRLARYVAVIVHQKVIQRKDTALRDLIVPITPRKDIHVHGPA